MRQCSNFCGHCLQVNSIPSTGQSKAKCLQTGPPKTSTTQGNPCQTPACSLRRLSALLLLQGLSPCHFTYGLRSVLLVPSASSHPAQLVPSGMSHCCSHTSCEPSHRLLSLAMSAVNPYSSGYNARFPSAPH